MTVTVVRDKGVTVVTMATDRTSMLPPLCQILKTLCYSPMCCSPNKGLMQSDTVSVLGTIQIMVGLFNIGLGPGRISLHPGDFAHLGVAYWLGGLFIAAGIVSLLADRLPSRCLVGFAVLMNIVGAIAATVGVVMYGIDVEDVSSVSLCDEPQGRLSDSNCRFVQYYLKRLLTAMDMSMIVLVILQLLTCINIAVLGIKALINPRKEEGGRDDETHQPALKEVLMTSPGA